MHKEEIMGIISQLIELEIKKINVDILNGFLEIEVYYFETNKEVEVKFTGITSFAYINNSLIKSSISSEEEIYLELQSITMNEFIVANKKYNICIEFFSTELYINTQKIKLIMNNEVIETEI